MRRQLVERELTASGVGGVPQDRNRSRVVSVNIAESPLGWLHARGHLTDRQFAAGESLRRDYELAELPQGTTMRWDPVRVRGNNNSGLNATERQISAKSRFDGAMDAAGSDLADILWRIVCAGETLPLAERALAWPVRSGKLVLRIALDRVAKFYRAP